MTHRPQPNSRTCDPRIFLSLFPIRPAEHPQTHIECASGRAWLASSDRSDAGARHITHIASHRTRGSPPHLQHAQPRVRQSQRTHTARHLASQTAPVPVRGRFSPRGTGSSAQPSAPCAGPPPHSLHHSYASDSRPRPATYSSIPYIYPFCTRHAPTHTRGAQRSVSSLPGCILIPLLSSIPYRHTTTYRHQTTDSFFLTMMNAEQFSVSLFLGLGASRAAPP